jgi:hypothetical protein
MAVDYVPANAPYDPTCRSLRLPIEIVNSHVGGEQASIT